MCSVWRWRWDLNPRWSYPHTRFRGVLLRPLGHATAGRLDGVPEPRRCREEIEQQPRALLLRTPPTTSTRWFARGSRATSHTEPHAPALGSKAPNTHTGTRASTIAPAHMTHGSRVATSVQPSSRQDPSTWAAARGSRRSPRGRSGPPRPRGRCAPRRGPRRPDRPRPRRPARHRPARATAATLERPGHPRGVPRVDR